MSPPSPSNLPATTLSVTTLRGALSEAAREEVVRAIQVHGGAAVALVADEVRATFGAPRQYRDHSLRAVRAACDQVEYLNGMCRDSHSGSACVVALAIPAKDGLDFTEPLLLSRSAREASVLVTQAVVAAAITQLPETWEMAHALEDTLPAVLPGLLPPHGELRAQSTLLGANVLGSPEFAAFRFRCVGLIPPDRGAAPVAVFAVDRPERLRRLLAGDTPDLFAAREELRVGCYRLLELVGQGATAEVWRAHDDCGQVVALKRLRGGAAATEQLRRRFEREGEILSRLQHPNICPVRAVGVADGEAFIAMEFIEGATLAETLAALGGTLSSLDARASPGEELPSAIARIEAGRAHWSATLGNSPTVIRPATADSTRMSVPEVLILMRKLCAAIEYAHRQGVLHRDLKPGNIMVRPNGEPVITDFGLGKLIGAGESSLSLADSILGTLEYMAPEQARSSRDVDERADVYALGAILYQLLTGRKHFFPSGNLLHDAQRLQTHEPIPPREIVPQLDDDLALIARQALRNAPLARYASAASLLADLDRYALGSAVLAHPPSMIEILRSRLDDQRRRAAALVIAIRRRFS